MVPPAQRSVERLLTGEFHHQGCSWAGSDVTSRCAILDQPEGRKPDAEGNTLRISAFVYFGPTVTSVAGLVT